MSRAEICQVNYVKPQMALATVHSVVMYPLFIVAPIVCVFV